METNINKRNNWYHFQYQEVQWKKEFKPFCSMKKRVLTFQESDEGFAQRVVDGGEISFDVVVTLGTLWGYGG